MASKMELRGTTFPSFQIGKRGPLISQALTDGMTLTGNSPATGNGGAIALVGGDATGASLGGSINLTPGSATNPGSVNLNPTGVAAGRTAELRFLELAANGTNYIGFKAPDAVVPANVTMTLPGTTPRPLQGMVTGVNSNLLEWNELSHVIPRGRTVAWVAAGNSVTVVARDIAALATVGTATTINTASTTPYGIIRKVEFNAAAVATAVAGVRYGQAMWYCGGGAANIGGFAFNALWGPSVGLANATRRAFMGMSANTGAATDVLPSSIANIIGMGWELGDTSIQIMHRGAAAITKVPLGAGSFPVPSVDRADLYLLQLYAVPGTTQSVTWTVTNIITGATATGVITTNLPLTTQGLTPACYTSVGGTSSVVGFALSYISINTNYY
jgi:hypothetical protein